MENQLVTILRITTPQLGSFVKDKLESEGIECFFTNEELTIGSKYNPDEVLLNVMTWQSEKAVKLLMQIYKDYKLNKAHINSSFKGLKKILFPVELSDDCFELCKYVFALAEKINAEIKLLYVYKDPMLNVRMRHTASWEKHVKLQLSEACEEAQFKLVEFSKDLKKHIPKELFNTVKFHYRILKGTPQNVIIDAAKRYKPDVIVMGTRGTKNEKSEFNSKTLVEIIECSKYPVLTVPVFATFKRKEKISVMYATDFYEADGSSLDKLLDILKSFEKEVHCIHVDVNNNLHHHKKIDKLNEMLAKKYSGQNIECQHFKSKNVKRGFDDFVTKNNIDIISFSKLKRSMFYKMFHFSLLEKLVSNGKVPMLIFPV